MAVDLIELKTLKFLRIIFLEPIFVHNQLLMLHILILQYMQFLAVRMEIEMVVLVIGIH